jgi:hypothetical protein
VTKIGKLWTILAVIGNQSMLWRTTRNIPEDSILHHYHCEKLKSYVVKTTFFLHIMLQLLVTTNIVPSSLILVTMFMVVIYSSKSSILTRAICHNMPEGGILYLVLRYTQYLMSKWHVYSHFTCYLGELEGLKVIGYMVLLSIVCDRCGLLMASQKGVQCPNECFNHDHASYFTYLNSVPRMKLKNNTSP